MIEKKKNEKRKRRISTVAPNLGGDGSNIDIYGLRVEKEKKSTRNSNSIQARREREKEKRLVGGCLVLHPSPSRCHRPFSLPVAVFVASGRFESAVSLPFADSVCSAPMRRWAESVWKLSEQKRGTISPLDPSKLFLVGTSRIRWWRKTVQSRIAKWGIPKVSFWPPDTVVSSADKGRKG